MITGHYAVGLALKAHDTSIPLWVLFVAVQLVDILFMVFLLAGAEHLRITPGISAYNNVEFYHYPYTHSLLMTPIWAAGLALLYFFFKKATFKTAIIIALAVASHWLLDLIVHVPDLPLYGDQHKVGLELWNQPWAAIALEIAFVAVGVLLYVKSGLDSHRRRPVLFGILVVLLIMLPIAGYYMPVHGMVEAMIGGLFIYVVFTLSAFFLDR